MLGAVCAERGLYDQAIAAHEKAGAIIPSWRAPLARTYAQAGRADDARKVIADIEPKATGMDAWFLAQARIVVGDDEEALRWIEASYTARWSWVHGSARTAPYAPLGENPRFKAILARMHLPS